MVSEQNKPRERPKDTPTFKPLKNLALFSPLFLTLSLLHCLPFFICTPLFALPTLFSLAFTHTPSVHPQLQPCLSFTYPLCCVPTASTTLCFSFRFPNSTRILMGKIQRSIPWAQALLVLLSSISISISFHAQTPPLPHPDTHALTTTATQPQQLDQGSIPNNNDHRLVLEQHVPESLHAAPPAPPTIISQLGSCLAKSPFSFDSLASSQQKEDTAVEKNHFQKRSPRTVNHSPHPIGNLPLATTPRPATKSSLLTDYEYVTMWDPQPDTIRFGVLLPLNAIDPYLEASIVRKSLSVNPFITFTCALRGYDPYHVMLQCTYL